MDRQIFQDALVFISIIVGMGCFTGIVITVIKRRAKTIPSELTNRLAEIADRLGRLESSVDSSALEIERIAEGQRFTTKLLSGRNPAQSDKLSSGPSAPR